MAITLKKINSLVANQKLFQVNLSRSLKDYYPEGVDASSYCPPEVEWLRESESILLLTNIDHKQLKMVSDFFVYNDTGKKKRYLVEFTDIALYHTWEGASDVYQPTYWFGDRDIALLFKLTFGGS